MSVKIKLNRQNFVNKFSILNSINSEKDGTFLLSLKTDYLDLISYSKTKIIRTRFDEFESSESSCEIVLPIKRVFQTLSLLKDDELTLSIDEKKMVIGEGKSKHIIQSTDKSLYSNIHNEIEFTEQFFFNTEQFKLMMDFTHLSMSKIDTAQFNLRAWNLIINPDFIRFSACDGMQYSMGEIETSTDLMNNENLNITLPFESYAEVKAFLGKTKQNFRLSYSPSYIKFEFEDIEFFVNQSITNFPDISKLVNMCDGQEFSDFDADHQELLRLIKLVKLNEDSTGQKLKFRLRDNQLNIELKSSLGEGLESFRIKYQKDERLFSTTDKNLIDFLTKYDRVSTFKVFDVNNLPLMVSFYQDNLKFIYGIFLSRVD